MLFFVPNIPQVHSAPKTVGESELREAPTKDRVATEDNYIERCPTLRTAARGGAFSFHQREASLLVTRPGQSTVAGAAGNFNS